MSVSASGVCPICAKPLTRAYHPFCSKRCADIDLSRWLKGVYAIPAAAPEDGEAPAGTPADGGEETPSQTPPRGSGQRGG